MLSAALTWNSLVQAEPALREQWRAGSNVSESDRPDPRRYHADDPTQVLLEGAKSGQEQAVELLMRRYGPRLRRWATGRLPGHARHIDDTEDIVQDVLVQAMHNVGHFEQRQEGAFHSYLRTAVLNRIRNRVRHAGVKGRAQQPVIDTYQPPRSPLEELIGVEALERYERALAGLRETDRELVVASVELDCSYEELAELTERPSPNAARMALKRALVRLATAMDEPLPGGRDHGATEVLR
jgi:RNA polymerase sigma-70 factor (ECF subfamily)